MMAQKSFEPEESNVSEAESISEGMEIKEFGGEWTRVYIWLSPFAVHPKLSHFVNWQYPNIK